MFSMAFNEVLWLVASPIFLFDRGNYVWFFWDDYQPGTRTQR